MRTELLSGFERKCSEINADVTLSLFIINQFLRDNTKNINDNPTILTSSFYNDNIYSKSFNVNLDHIPNLVSQNLLFVSKSSYIVLWTSFEGYMKDMIDFIKDITGKKPKKNALDTENIFIVANSDVNDCLSKEDIDTIDYIRKRRNQLTHNRGEIKEELLTIINKGNDLNKYWKDNNLPMNVLDFSDLLISGIDNREVIDIIRLLRALSAKIDHEALTKVGKQPIIDYALRKFKKEFAEKMKHKPRARVETMFLNVLARGFNLTKDDVDIASIIF